MIPIIAAECKLFWISFPTSNRNIEQAALGALLALAPFGLFWWLRRRDIRQANKLLEAMNPLKLTFDISGLNTTEKNGSRNFVPWSQFDGFREGKTVVLLREAGSGEYRVIPKETDPPSDSNKLVSAIRSRLIEIRWPPNPLWALPQNLPRVSFPMKNRQDLQRYGIRTIYDGVIGIARQGPEEDRSWGQIAARMAPCRSLRRNSQAS